MKRSPKDYLFTKLYFGLLTKRIDEQLSDAKIAGNLISVENNEK